MPKNIDFWSNINVRSAEECWEWKRRTDKDGYGKCTWKSKTCRAHRLAFTLSKGDPGPLHVLHSCDNPICCNPSHLFLGSNQDNVDDKVLKSRQSHQGCSLNPSKGEAHGRSALTEAIVREIRNKYKPRLYPLVLLAKEYSISVSQVHKIVARKDWTHI